MTLNEVVEYCHSLEGVFERRPFGPQPLVMCVPPRKGFCDIYEKTEPLHIVVKTTPLEAAFLRMSYPCVKPGYHCNKKYWNSIYLDGSLPDEMIKQMILKSYTLVLKAK